MRSHEFGIADPESPARMLLVLLIFYAVEIPVLLLERLPRFRLQQLLLIVAVICVLLGVVRARPALGSWLTILALPAFLWTCIVRSCCNRAGRAVGASKTVLIFLVALGYMLFAIFVSLCVIAFVFPHMVH
jgi:hypothetical protein